MIRRRFSVPKFSKEDYMTITALEDMTVCLNFSSTVESLAKYRIGEGEWIPYNSSEYLSVPAQSYIQFCCVYVKTSGSLLQFKIEGKCDLSGNCLSILYGDEYRKKNYIFYDSCFSYLFENCVSIQSVSKDFLPATTLANGCYYSMFSGCTSLVNAPELPATTLANGCYHSMFSGCTSLVNAPELPATTLADNCYSLMFRGCTNLNYIKMLATDISAGFCLDTWVYGVASSGTFVKNSAMTSLPTGKSGIPAGWTVENA